MDVHLTADELRRFAQHEGSAADVRRIARHLQSCVTCRGDAPSRGLISGILGADDEHLTFEQLAAMADGEVRDDDHLHHCATCTRELADLREFRESVWRRPPSAVVHHDKPDGRGRPSPHRSIAVAAAVLIALAGGGFFFARIEQQRSDARLADVALPAEVLAMQSRRLSFRGETGHPELDVIEPRNAVVMSDRPVFRWNAPAGATSVVEIFDSDFTRVARSPELTSRTWTPPVALRRGVTYRWQVTAGDVTIPAPPLPEALFIVVPEAEAQAVRDLERSAQPPSLELAAAYAKAGDFERARGELRALLDRGQQTQAAEKLLRRINVLH